MPTHPYSPAGHTHEAAAQLQVPIRTLQKWLTTYSPTLIRLHEDAVRSALRLLEQTERAMREG